MTERDRRGGFWAWPTVTERGVAALGYTLQTPREDRYLMTSSELARKIASKSPRAIRLGKWSLNGIELLDIKKSYRFEQGFTLELYMSDESQEARDAFVEKRDASFD